VYLSRIQLNKHRRESWRLLSSPQRLHAAVLASFPDPPTGARADGARVLWRLDTETRDRTFLYVVSPDQPDFSHLAEQAGWPSVDRGASKDYAPFLARLECGQRWRFRLTANPTRYVRPDLGVRAKRVAHVSAAHQEAWLVERSSAHGFTVSGADGARDLVITARGSRRFDRSGSSGPVTLAVAQFDGTLEITDPELLRRALTTGIGPAKAYGCGLLTLAPV